MNLADLHLFDLIDAWVVVLDIDGLILGCNRACQEGLGLSPGEARGGRFWERFSAPEEHARVREGIQRTLEGEPGGSFETSLIGPDGARHRVAWSVRGVDEPGGASRLLVATGVDRTERAEAEEQRAWFERIVTASEDAIVSSTPAGVIRSWNPAAERIFGYTAAEAIGSPARIIYPEGDLTDRRAVIERMMRGEIVTEYDALRRRKDGTVFPVAMTGSLIRDRSGQIIGILGIARDITEQKRAQEAQAWLASIVTSSYDAIISTDLDGVIRSWNPAAERIYGYTAAEIVGRSSAILLPEDRRDERRQLLDGLRRGQSMQLETVRRRKDGTDIPISITASPLRDREGRVVGTSTIVRDLRERNELRARLDEERRWLRQVIESAPVGIVLYDRAQRVNANRSAEELLGMELVPERGTGQYRERLRRLDGTPLPEDELFARRAVDTGASVGPEEVHVTHPDGRTFLAVVNAAPVFDGERRLLGSVVIFTDVTSYRQTQREREVLAARIERLIEVMPVGVWVADEAGRIALVNPAAQQIWEGVHADPGEYRAWQADTGAPIPPEEGALVRAVRGETVRGQIVRIQSFGGREKTLLISATPLLDREGRTVGAVLINEDITALRETEEQLRRAVREREDVLSVVSHDLRNPLNSINLSAMLVQRALRRGRPVNPEAVDLMIQSTERMRRLIDDLLDVSKLEAGTLAVAPTRHSAAGLVADALAVERPQAGGRALVDEVADDAGDVLADYDRVQQVLANLLGNAVKFTREDGRVAVGARAEGREVRFWVADDGPGIPLEHQAHLFDRFWQADRRDRRGAGLGLSIVLHLVKAHGGRVWVESAPGAGATFFFTLPAAAG